MARTTTSERTVYVLTEEDLDGMDVVGVYGTEEAACCAVPGARWKRQQMVGARGELLDDSWLEARGGCSLYVVMAYPVQARRGPRPRRKA